MAIDGEAAVGALGDGAGAEGGGSLEGTDAAAAGVAAGVGVVEGAGGVHYPTDPRTALALAAATPAAAAAGGLTPSGRKAKAPGERPAPTGVKGVRAKVGGCTSCILL
jgi:hypothetical protein